MAEKKAGRGADQFPLRFPEGMREEIKRLADEDDQSMNTKILELLDFALANSGIDVDGLLKIIEEQNAEMRRLRSVFEGDRTMASSILMHVLAFSDEIPPHLTVWADNMLGILNYKSTFEAGDTAFDEIKDEVELQKRLIQSKERYLQRTKERMKEISRSRTIGAPSGKK